MPLSPTDSSLLSWLIVGRYSTEDQKMQGSNLSLSHGDTEQPDSHTQLQLRVDQLFNTTTVASNDFQTRQGSILKIPILGQKTQGAGKHAFITQLLLRQLASR